MLMPAGKKYWQLKQAHLLTWPTSLVSLPALSACLPCQPSCLVSLPALSACLPCQPACLVSPPALSARLPCQPTYLVSPPALFVSAKIQIMLKIKDANKSLML
jgi:hypothetical protein